MNCHHKDDHGFCNRYSNDAVVWKCNERINCKDRTVDNPCPTCALVKHWQTCENKACYEWRQWYIERWETMRRNLNGRI